MLCVIMGSMAAGFWAALTHFAAGTEHRIMLLIGFLGFLFFIGSALGIPDDKQPRR